MTWSDGTFRWIEALRSAYSDEKGGAAVRMAGISMAVRLNDRFEPWASFPGKPVKVEIAR